MQVPNGTGPGVRRSPQFDWMTFVGTSTSKMLGKKINISCIRRITRTILSIHFNKLCIIQSSDNGNVFYHLRYRWLSEKQKFPILLILAFSNKHNRHLKNFYMAYMHHMEYFQIVQKDKIDKAKRLPKNNTNHLISCDSHPSATINDVKEKEYLTQSNRKFNNKLTTQQKYQKTLITQLLTADKLWHMLNGGGDVNTINHVGKATNVIYFLNNI